MAFLDETPIVIAEIGNNHGGSLDLAKQMVLAAVRAGTQYVKFQTMIPERLLSRDHPAFEEFSREALSFDAFRALARFCQEQGAVFLSTPFDPDSADFLEELGVPAFKISSGDLTYLPFLVHIARKHKPILLSTGCSTLEDIDRAVETIRRETEAELILMHCTAAYPCPDEEANLRVIPSLAHRYGCRVGFSDHTLSLEAGAMAVVAGATVVEKHFTLHTGDVGPDHKMSLMPGELARYVPLARLAGKAMGTGWETITEGEMVLRGKARRSLYATRDIEPGEVITTENSIALRPQVEGAYTPAALYIGTARATQGIQKGEAIR